MSSRRDFLAGSWLFWRKRKRSVTVGGARFCILPGHGEDRRYFWVHGNERSAREVLLAHRRRGRAVLVENQVRHLEFDGGRLDPNRMFSGDGAERNLHALNPDWSRERLDAALARLAPQRQRLLQELLPRPAGLLIAMHNNSSGYSVQEEIPISDQISLRQPGQPHEFILCTSPSDFSRLEYGPYNVVLQYRAPLKDDGSLSRLCAGAGVRYVNIEARAGAAQQQAAMLEWVDRGLP